MKYKIYILFFSAAVILMASGCDKSKQRMTVVKDCTGVYLRASNGQEYLVCNDEILDNIADGKKIKVSFDNLDECFGLIEPITCSETHTFEGKIEILEIF